jgi:hypothetical protein
MVDIALNEAHLAVLQMHLDAATAGAHVTGGGADFFVQGGSCGWGSGEYGRHAERPC